MRCGFFLRGHVVGGIVTGLLTAGPVLGGMAMLAVYPAVPFLYFAAHVVANHAALRHLARDGATAERRGTWLIIGGTRGNLELWLSESIFLAAQNAAVPTASAGTRRNTP